MTGSTTGSAATLESNAAISTTRLAIETHELRKEFGRIVALAGLTMTVAQGEVFGFLGPNGAGKTTAVKLLLGLSRPTAGGGRVMGAPLGDVPARRRIGYLPELFRYQGWMTAREVLALHCELARLPQVEWAPEIRATLELVGLGDRADWRTETFSKGMQQRLGLAVALLGRPELVVLDEPTSALDPVGRQDVRGIIRVLRNRGTTVFLNSHLLTEVERVCDRVAIVDRGRVVAELSMADLTRERGVSVLVTGLDGGGMEVAARFGPARADGEWLFVDRIPDSAVPELVGELVSLGGAIHAVVPTHQTLEERFLSLLGAAPETSDEDAPVASPEARS
ncbi:MAG: ABC transporter ATP-binding protein [Candidatus Limnocylindrales bacterium]|jgi:ABC-2 type transport system ATP-binding protein